jgi:hypothetical protein
MGEWWNSLTQLNQIFYAAAAFFSVFFLWQLAAALIGLGGHGEDVDHGGYAEHVDQVDHVEYAGHGDYVGDSDYDSAYDNFEHGTEADAAETGVTFRLLSIRSILTFFTLFTWGGALYLNRGEPPSTAMTYSVIWGLAGMFSIAFIFYGLRKLTKTGTSDLRTCIGKRGTVYLNIPEGGQGEIRAPVSGVVSHVKARSSYGKELRAGTPVRVVRRLDQTTVEVEPVEETKS